MFASLVLSSGVATVVVQLARFPDSKSSAKIVAALAAPGEKAAASSARNRARIRVVCIAAEEEFPDGRTRRRKADDTVRRRLNANMHALGNTLCFGSNRAKRKHSRALQFGDL